MLPTRRDFLSTTLAAVAGSSALAIDPIKRKGKASLQLSLAAYSYNRHLNLKGKPTMTLEDFVDVGAKLKLPAVELTQYYFAETTEKYLKAIKDRCDKNKLLVSGTAVGNDFCWPDKKKRGEQLKMVKTWVEHTAALGGKTMRIFAGTVKAKEKQTEADARKLAIDTIQEACDHAAKYKIYLALENHGGITATAEQLLAIVKAVKHDWFGVNLDTGNFRTKDPYGDLAKVAPYAVTVQVKSEIFPGGKREDADYKRLTDILRKVNYQGYVALEYEAKEDPKTAVPKEIARLRKYMD